MTNRGTFLDGEILIGAELSRKGTAGTMEHRYPATSEVNGTVNLCGASEVNDAVTSAKAAARVWQALAPTERRDRLNRLADIIAARCEQFRQLAAAEIGQPRQSFNTRYAWSLNWIRMYAGYADKIGGDVTATSDAAGTLEYTRLEPYGVVGIIITWNVALLSLAMKIPPALAAGNTVVVKPSELTPYTPILFGKACLEAGIPPGVVNIVPGGREAGEALVVHEDVEKISFTGGVATAMAMMRSGAAMLKPFCFELGGKSAQLVFADADIETAAALSAASLSNAGQSCVFGSRILVHDSIYPKFQAALLGAMQKVIVGDPQSAATQMGPLVTAQARDRVLSIIDKAVSERQGSLVLGGKAPRLQGELNAGYFVEPTLVSDVDPASPLAREEIFGPVYLLTRFSEENQAIEAANATRFGLSNFVYTRDLKRAVRVTSLLKSGTVYVNDASRQNAAAPFGGYRLSGIGYEGGRAGLDEYLRRKTVGLA